MDGATDQPFAALKEVAARLDVEIPNAANCLEGLPGLLETKLASTKAATKVSEQATLIEAELKLIALRLENVVKEKLVSIQELTECLKQTDCDNRETLQKLVPLGLKVPDHLLPGRFQTSSNLDKYLEEISSNDTITLMNSKQLVSLKAAKPEAASGSPDEGAAAPLPKIATARFGAQVHTQRVDSCKSCSGCPRLRRINVVTFAVRGTAICGRSLFGDTSGEFIGLQGKLPVNPKGT
ncbi:hypothetical protein HPB52_016158 [Rhipicephalus sanguineus]|uniref:Uncharacterized protein n=1 Tax=Rhipicephalus sanguineus TaxID=34632 RepID=A0A9D4PN92_RHISA|nr:hypothetical protein HPB52_016158 [Rhipicephalus sanguineus]